MYVAAFGCRITICDSDTDNSSDARLDQKGAATGRLEDAR